MQRIRPATIAALSVGRRNEELWCDSLTNGLWQDPGSHKDRTVLAPQWTDQDSMCVSLCVLVLFFPPFVYPVKCGWACLLTVKHTRSTPGGSTVEPQTSTAEDRWRPIVKAWCLCLSFSESSSRLHEDGVILSSSKREFHQRKSLRPTIKGSARWVIFEANGSRRVRSWERGKIKNLSSFVCKAQRRSLTRLKCQRALKAHDINDSGPSKSSRTRRGKQFKNIRANHRKENKKTAPQGGADPRFKKEVTCQLKEMLAAW